MDDTHGLRVAMARIGVIQLEELRALYRIV